VKHSYDGRLGFVGILGAARTGRRAGRLSRISDQDLAASNRSWMPRTRPSNSLLIVRMVSDPPASLPDLLLPHRPEQVTSWACSRT